VIVIRPFQILDPKKLWQKSKKISAFLFLWLMALCSYVYKALRAIAHKAKALRLPFKKRIDMLQVD